MEVPEIKTIDCETKPHKLIPRYKTGPTSRCTFNACGQCRICLHPEPREYFKLSHVNRFGPKVIPPGGYYERVQYGEGGDVDYYMYCPIYI